VRRRGQFSAKARTSFFEKKEAKKLLLLGIRALKPQGQKFFAEAATVAAARLRIFFKKATSFLR
jgi:hypothetical protein